ncbi:MAG: glycerol-3-phosphate dehydrogenase/oxidase [Planctomycetota bacterium]
MQRDLPLPKGPYDVAIVGGGINGTAIAREAVGRGLRVLLLEKGDLASGTSSASSKMIHGGIRYLEQSRFGLVFESLMERHHLLRLAPHLVRPQEFVLPVYQNSRRGLRVMKLGLWLYDKLCLGRRLGRSVSLTPDELLARLPELSPDGLLGGGTYWDAVMDDARLVVVNAVAAQEDAAKRSVPFGLRTYTEVTKLHAGQPNRLELHDHLLERDEEITAHRVIFTQGPWSERELLVPSRGTHIVLPRMARVSDGLLLEHSDDGRVFFIIPWLGRTLVGTTEVPYDGPADRVFPERPEVEYLLAELRRRFPGLPIQPADLLGVFAGIRPLARRPGKALTGPGAVSREHRIVDEGGGVFRVIGGKYTTYRAIARQVARQVFGHADHSIADQPLPGGELGGWSAARDQLGPEIQLVGEESCERLFQRYGSRLRDVLALGRANTELLDPLPSGGHALGAEVVYGVRHEFVTCADDFLERRTDLRYSPDQGRSAYDDTARHIESELPASRAGDPARKETFLERRQRELRVLGRPAPAAP